MAKAKKEPAPALHRSTAALVHGSNAFGARYLKQGFSFTPEQDLKFALGWPHMKELVDGHPDDAEPEKAARASLENDYPDIRLAWPRQVALRLARFHSTPLVHDYSNVNPETGLPGLTAAAAAALADATPLSADEARARIAEMFTEQGSRSFSNRIEGALYLLEAFVGPDAVLDAAVTALCGYSPERVLNAGRSLRDAPLAIGMLLLRVPEAERARQMARLEELFQKSSGSGIVGELLGPLDAMLHGAAGIRSAWPGYRIHVLDDPGLVAEGRRSKPNDVYGDLPDPRIVFLGGEAAYEVERRLWKKYDFLKPAVAWPLIVERMGEIRSPITVALLLELSALPKSKKQALAWFAEHADYARPQLEKIAAGGGAEADLAKAVLKAKS